jgi:regulator of replication initiation timing
MKKINRVLMLSVLSMLIFSGVLLAREYERNGAVEGTFVRLVEQEFDGQGYMGIIIKPHERDDHVTVLVPRQRAELWQAARRLREGQRIGISFVTEAGHNWIKGMEAERREIIEERPEGRRRMSIRRDALRYEYGQERQMEEFKRILFSHLDNMVKEYRMLRRHMEDLEREVQRLRLENEHLRRELRERFRSESEREREIGVRRQREGTEPEERERPRECDEGRARGELPRSEREIALHQLEVMRMVLHALREAERSDAAELLALAVRSCEMMLEGRRGEEAQRLRERAPNRRQITEILSMASRLWREFGNADKSVAVGQLAEQFSRAEEPQVREREEREVRRRRLERRESDLPAGMIGFRGVLVGRIIRKLDRGFVLKVEKVDRIWESNRADRPEAAVGKELIINIREDEELSSSFLDTLRALETGQRVLVEAFHFGGNSLVVVEQLKKME